MTSATKKIGRAQTVKLLEWMQQVQPRVYAGLVRRFTPATPANQMNGIWDAITGMAGKVVDGVTNFVNSQGASNLITAAAPFLQTKLEKEQLQLQLQRMQAGLPPQTYGQPYGTGSQLPSGQYIPGSMYPLETQQQEIPPWVWIAGAGALGFLLLRRR